MFWVSVIKKHFYITNHLLYATFQKDLAWLDSHIDLMKNEYQKGEPKEAEQSAIDDGPERENRNQQIQHRQTQSN